MQTIGANVRALRRKAELSQADLAEAAGLSVVGLSKIEGGLVDLYVSTLMRLARALGVKPQALFAPAKFAPPSIGRPPATGRPAKPRTKRA
jgi:transcriptional regulator with XRE-family HTH domain